MIDSQEVPRITEDYSAYLDLLQQVNGTFPQRQGMFEDEYSHALDNPLVTCSFVEDGTGRRVAVPRISPVEAYSWLNPETYMQRFPEEYGRGAVKHLFDGHNMGDLGVAEGLEMRRLAAEKGVLVFDYPDTDPEYATRVFTKLDALGVSHSELESLGTQTYFAGKVRLKSGYDPTQPVKGLHEAFQGMVLDGVIAPQSYLNGASYVQNITAEDATRMYPHYEAAFQKLNTHPCRQGLAPEEFLEVMTNDPETAKLRYSVDGQTATLMVLGDNLENYDWINPQFYAAAYPEEYNSRQILYFPALYTDTAMQGDATTEHVVNLIAEMVEYGNNEIIVAFDCCDINVGFLDAYIEALVNATPQASIAFDTLGTQHYAAVRLG